MGMAAVLVCACVRRINTENVAIPNLARQLCLVRLQLPASIDLEAHAVLAKIAADLHLDQFERDLARVCDPCPERGIDNMRAAFARAS
jgi:hypothetical protein